MDGEFLATDAIKATASTLKLTADILGFTHLLIELFPSERFYRFILFLSYVFHIIFLVLFIPFFVYSYYFHIFFSPAHYCHSLTH